MQFMITRHSQKTSWDKFEVQDIAIEKFRKFATEHNVSTCLLLIKMIEQNQPSTISTDLHYSAKFIRVSAHTTQV